MENPPVIDLTASPPRKKTAYKNQATKLLRNAFPRISCKAIDVVLNHVDFKYTDAFYILSEFQASTPENVVNVVPQLQDVKVVFLKHLRAKKSFNVQNLALLEELDGISEMNTKENDPPTIDNIEEEVSNDAAILVECGCCYGEYPSEHMKECSAGAGHACCKNCIYRYVSEQLDGNNSIQFRCIVSDKCSEIYPTTTLLDQVLTPNLKSRVNDREFRSQVGQAHLEGIWNCPRCAYMGFLDKQYPTVFCDDCKVEYCTECNQVAHKNKSCKEFKAERERLKNPIHRAHEAMSKATIRSCPSCSTQFQKYDGCNKMTCPKCKTLSCYLCGVKVQDYSHFCPNMDCPCTKCKLWGNSEEQDRQARYQAGLKVLQDAGMNAEEIDQALASPAGKKKVADPPPTPTAPRVAPDQRVVAPPQAEPPQQAQGFVNDEQEAVALVQPPQQAPEAVDDEQEAVPQVEPPQQAPEAVNDEQEAVPPQQAPEADENILQENNRVLRNVIRWLRR